MPEFPSCTDGEGQPTASVASTNRSLAAKLGEEAGNRSPAIGRRHRAIAIVQVSRGIDLHGSENGCKQVGNGNGIFNSRHRQFIAHAVGSTMFEASTGEYGREALRIVATATA